MKKIIRLLIKWLIRVLLKGYHLHKSPIKKIKESQPSTPLVQLQEGDSGFEPVRMED